jgi:hypothetical protein
VLWGPFLFVDGALSDPLSSPCALIADEFVGAKGLNTPLCVHPWCPQVGGGGHGGCADQGHYRLGLLLGCA